MFTAFAMIWMGARLFDGRKLAHGLIAGAASGFSSAAGFRH